MIIIKFVYVTGIYVNRCIECPPEEGAGRGTGPRMQDHRNCAWTASPRCRVFPVNVNSSPGFAGLSRFPFLIQCVFRSQFTIWTTS